MFGVLQAPLLLSIEFDVWASKEQAYVSRETQFRPKKALNFPPWKLLLNCFAILRKLQTKTQISAKIRPF